MDDLMIIELYFARDEQAIEETDTKYGKLCFHMANNLSCTTVLRFRNARLYAFGCFRR